LLFRRWPGLEINRIICEVTASLTVTDDEGYVNIAGLCQLVGLVNQGRLPSSQPFASSFGWFDSHDDRGYSLKIKRGTRYFKYSKLNLISILMSVPENLERMAWNRDIQILNSREVKAWKICWFAARAERQGPPHDFGEREFPSEASALTSVAGDRK
jgi:hypothetical protein